MKKAYKEILVGYGLGNLKFGVTRDDVRKLLGDPDEVESFSYTETDQDMAESWHYDEMELSMIFEEEEDWRLVTLSVSDSFYEFKGIIPIGMTKEVLLAELEKLDIDDIDHEDSPTNEHPTHELYTSDVLDINFWLDGNIVSEIQWGPSFNDDDTIKWPE